MRAHQFALGPFDPVAYFHSLKRREECFVRAYASAIACGIALAPGCDASGWSQRTSLATGTHDTASSTQNDSSLCRFVFYQSTALGALFAGRTKRSTLFHLHVEAFGSKNIFLMRARLGWPQQLTIFFLCPRQCLCRDVRSIDVKFARRFQAPTFLLVQSRG